MNARSARQATASSVLQHVLAITGMLALSAGVAQSANAKDNPKCKDVVGAIVPACNASSCLQGVITGDIEGTYVSTLTSIYPTPLGYVVTGATSIDLTKHKGTLVTFDSGTAPALTDGQPDLANASEVLTLTDASGHYEGYSGSVRITGAYVLGQPTPYAGQLCKRGSVDGG